MAERAKGKAVKEEEEEQRKGEKLAKDWTIEKQGDFCEGSCAGSLEVPTVGNFAEAKKKRREKEKGKRNENKGNRNERGSWRNFVTSVIPFFHRFLLIPFLSLSRSPLSPRSSSWIGRIGMRGARVNFFITDICDERELRSVTWSSRCAW